MANMRFRKVRPSEADHAYSIICETVEWLRSKNIKQWTEPLPREVFDSRQLNGENFALVLDGSLAVVLSIVKESPTQWLAETKGRAVWWLCTLATANQFRGRDLGRVAVERAIEHVRREGVEELFLDCPYGNGFLPWFYESLGFECAHRKIVDWPKCGPTDMVLMRCQIMESTDR